MQASSVSTQSTLPGSKIVVVVPVAVVVDVAVVVVKVVVLAVVTVVDVAVVVVVFVVKVEVVVGHAPSPGMQSEAPLQVLPILCGATSTL